MQQQHQWRFLRHLHPYLQRLPPFLEAYLEHFQLCQESCQQAYFPLPPLSFQPFQRLYLQFSDLLQRPYQQLGFQHL